MVFKEAVKLKKKEGILEYVRSNIVGSKKVYLFRGKTRKFGRMEETKIEYKSGRQTYIKRN